MKVKINQRCPHCDKAISIKEIEIDKASYDEVRDFFKNMYSS